MNRSTSQVWPQSKDATAARVPSPSRLATYALAVILEILILLGALGLALGVGPADHPGPVSGRAATIELGGYVVALYDSPSRDLAQPGEG